MSVRATTTTCRCPHCGADSTTADYCDGCGGSLDPTRPAAPAAATAVAPVPTPPAVVCAGCGSGRAPGDAFCELCGLDFTTGEPAPAPVELTADPGTQPAGAASDWTAVVEADRAVFDANAEASPDLTFPTGLAKREVPLTGDEISVGRRNEAKGFFPQIDLSSPVPDPAVSRHHAVLRRRPDGTWALVDQGSANGTWVNDAAAPLMPGAATPLQDGDRVRLGAFTVLRMRRNRESS